MKLTIAMATYNSMKILPMVYESIKKQTLDPQLYGLLFVDGGSTDGTLEFARQHNIKILDNPKKEPVHAKYLAYLETKSQYLMYLDHDEVLENPRSLEIKLRAFEENPRLLALAPTGYTNPKGYHYINNYINEFGDPFSFFIYHISKNAKFYIKTMSSKYNIAKDTPLYVLFEITKSANIPLIELLAGGSVFDAKFCKETFPQTLEKSSLLTHLFYMLMEKSPVFCITKNDTILHYSSDTLKGYFKKIEWRVRNNIYFKDQIGQSGFSGREKYDQKSILRIKKFLFIPYAFTLAGPLYDALYLAITRKNLSYFVHIPLTLFTAWQIVFHTALNFFGYSPALKAYDGSKITKR